METAIRELMGAGTPPRFKFKDTHASIEFPSGYTIPTQATLEAKYDELLALEEGIQKMVMEGDLEVGTSNLFVDTETGNVGIGTPLPAYKLDVHGSSNVGALTATSVSGDGSGLTSLNASNVSSGTLTRPISTTTGTFSGNVGIGTASPLQTLHVAGNGQNPVIYMADSTNTRYASGMGTHHVGNEGQRLDFYNGDSGANGTSLGSSHIRMSIKHNGNVGIGTTNPRASLDIGGTTFNYYNEYRYQDSWTSNNNQTFTIPVTGGSARGEMLVEAEVIQVAANSSSERMARVKGIITNYHTGTFNMTVFEGENATAFETYIVGTSGSAAGTFTMKYQPQAGYLQNVLCGLNLKIFIGGFTSSLGSLTRTDAGSNSALTAPTLNSAPKIFGGNVGIGSVSPMNTGLHIANSYFASGGNTTHLDPQIFITGDSGTNGAQVSAIGFSGNSTADVHQRMVAGSVYYKGGGGNYGMDGYLGIAVANSSTSGTDPYGLTEGELESHTRIAIKNNGNVGIGKTNPGAELDVNGTIRTSSTSTNIVSDIGSVVTISSTTPTTILDVQITTRGNKVLILVTGDLQPKNGTTDWLYMRLYRGTTAIGVRHLYHPGTGASTNQVFAVHTIDHPAAGTYTYSLKGYRGNGDIRFDEGDPPEITAIEFL
jgi:hypothetical protein